MRSLSNHPSERITQKRSTPELQASSRSRLSAHIAGFKTNPVYDRHIYPISDSVCTLNRAPRIVLGRAKFRLLGRVPTDGSRIEKDMRSLQSREPRSFGIPLIPAHQRAHASNLGIRSEEDTSELQSHVNLVCRLLLEK